MAYYGEIAVKANGQHFTPTTAIEEYPADCIPMGHRLMVVLGNGIYEIASDVTDPVIYRATYMAYCHNVWTSMVLYILAESLVEECLDEAYVESRKRRQDSEI